MTPDYTTATADVLTAATLAKPEAKKAAVKAVLESYFPATGETPAPWNGTVDHILKINPDGRVEEWEGSTYRATYLDVADAANEIMKRRKAK